MVRVLRHDDPGDGPRGKEVFATEVGDPATLAPTRVNAKLTKFAGKRVKLRLAEVDNQDYFHAGVDSVKLKSEPKK